jgi:hypothetical protein
MINLQQSLEFYPKYLRRASGNSLVARRRAAQMWKPDRDLLSRSMKL